MPRSARGSDAGRRFAALLTVLAGSGLAAPASAQVMIGPPSSTAVVRTPQQQAREREEQARQAWREERVNEKIATMGKHREAEARRLVAMEEAAGRARGGHGAADAVRIPAERQCRHVDDGVKTTSTDQRDRAAAQKWVRGSADFVCVQRGGPTGMSMTCNEKALPPRRVPVAGNPLKFTREPGGTVWSCSATYRCAQPKEVCGDGGPAGATRQ